MKTSPFRVLVVDDEHVVADSLTLILNSAGYDARAVYSGEDATALAETMSPHAVISDVIMPGMSGVDLGEWLRRHQPGCKLLLLSGHPVTALMLDQAAHRGHIFPILPKPVRPEEILTFLSDHAVNA